MKKWLRRIRGSVLMGLMWALAWGIIGGAVMEGIIDPHGRILDMWPQTLAIPGFLAGATFSVVLGIAERRRGFSELSLPRFAALGATAGVLLGLFVVALLGELPLWPGAAFIIVPMTLMSAASAAGSLALARKGEDGEVLEAGAEAGEVGLTDDEVKELLGSRRGAR